ncbi:MAG: dephospho-CoA kinase [Candidatus Acidiferrales bacterium]|jgi:dephospho-CoA kinase
MLRIGLTGGIASGKSTVASMLRDLDCPVLAADALGHELLEPGQTAYAEVVREFGIDILDSYGNVDRTALGEIVFADEERREKLNSILHPRIREIIEKWFAALDQPGGPELAIVEAALIIEAGFNQNLDKLIVCWCRRAQQVERLLERGLTEEQALQRIAAQMPMEEKRSLADETIDCSGTLEETERAVEVVVKRLMDAAAAGRNIP